MNTIVLVDDEEDILAFISYNLKKEGFTVYTADSGEKGLELCKEVKPDLAILDVMMPGIDGVELCEQIRSTPELKHILICFLTARNEDYSQIAGFDAGADDYIAKPIKPKLLISRINAILRRKHIPDETKNINFEINREKYLVISNGKEVRLPRKEFELLALLTTKPNHVFERHVILEHVWGSDVVVGDRTIDVHVRKIREKIGDQYIETIKGIGYKFVS
jgi:two-component system alkaline phosphatase synthesis response regulator PhoP